MNIFAVDSDPSSAAMALHDSHVVKMATESAQILSTLIPEDRAEYRQGKRFLRSSGERIYRPTHRGHPCVVWAGRRRTNWSWLHAHALALCAEYEHRFQREHGASRTRPGPGVQDLLRRVQAGSTRASGALDAEVAAELAGSYHLTWRSRTTFP